MQKHTHHEEMPDIHPAITTRKANGARGAIHQQGTKCGHRGCGNRIRLTVNDGQAKTLKQFTAAARGRGWELDETVDAFFCPDHKPGKAEEPMPTPSETKPREMTKTQRRAIFREIDEGYDEKAQSYVEGASDRIIADKLSVPWGWVAEVREENFGPAGPDPKVKELVAQIEKLERVAKTVEEMGMRAAEQAEKLATDVANAKAQLGQMLHLSS